MDKFIVQLLVPFENTDLPNGGKKASQLLQVPCSVLGSLCQFASSINGLVTDYRALFPHFGTMTYTP